MTDSQARVQAGALAAEALVERGVDHVFFIAGGHTYPLMTPWTGPECACFQPATSRPRFSWPRHGGA